MQMASYNCEDWEDHFPWDPTEQFDGNNDGKGDNANKLSLMDDISAEPLPFVAIGLVIALLVGLVARTAGSREEVDEFDDYDETEEFLDEDDEEDEEVEAGFGLKHNRFPGLLRGPRNSGNIIFLTLKLPILSVILPIYRG